MKKFALLLLCAFIAAATYSVPALAVDRSACYAVYLNSRADGAVNLYKNVYMLECDEKTALNYRNIHNAIGYSKRFKGKYEDMRAEAEKHGARIVKSELIGEVYIYYAYSESLGKPVTVDGKSVNMQLAIRGGTITVGTPLIMGSY